MSDPVRTLINGDVGLKLLTTRFGDLFYHQGELSSLIRTARIVESIVLSLLSASVAAYLMHATLSAAKPGIALGIAIGVGLAYGAHQVRQTVLLDKRVTDYFRPYNSSFGTLYHDAFSILKGKWQILEASAVATVAVAVLGATLRTAPMYPFAAAFFAAMAAGAVGTYLAADWLIGRSFRQI